MFVAHLRTLRPNSTQVPAMSTLLPLPFLSRLATEDTYVGFDIFRSHAVLTAASASLRFASTLHPL